jgi:multidrug efflux system outer membrane protein
MDAAADIAFAGAVPIVPLVIDSEQLILAHLPRRPDIVHQRQAVTRLELSRSVTTLNARAPTLELSTQWQGSPRTPPPQGLGAPFADRLRGDITLTIPVDSWIPGTRQNQNIRGASAEVEKALLDVQAAETSAKTEIRTLTATLGNTWESLSIARLRTELAERSVEAAGAGFQGGRVSFQELEDRRRDLADSRQRLLQGELAYQSLLLDLAAALNVPWRELIHE